MFIKDNDISTIERKANDELIKISNWMLRNKLSLNILKTQGMLFGYKSNNVNSLQISVNNTNIKLVERVKFLGVIFDNKLTWKAHIQYIATKIAKGIGIINKLKYKLNQCTKRMLYFTFVYPYLIYCITTWGMLRRFILVSLLCCKNVLLELYVI